MLEIALMVAGFVLLIKGADFVVEGASIIAKKLRISDLVIGLTIVAFGTSTPELLVNVFASLQGNSAIAFGNILGSNVANILLILGFSAVIYPLAITKNTVLKEIPLSFLAVIVLAVLVNDTLLGGYLESVLTMSDGMVLLFFFAIFMYYAFNSAIHDPAFSGEVPKTKHGTLRAAILFLVGLVGLYLGGELVVNNAVMLAKNFGISDALIGLTIIAVGTSLPELATSAVAALNKNANIAVGNIVGSNIFNIFFVLGISSIIRPLPFNPATNFDIFMVGVATVVLMASIFVGKKQVIEKWNGAVFLFLYVAYIIFLVLRG